MQRRSWIALGLAASICAGSAGLATWAAANDADNTTRNTRDRDDKTLTPMDQGKSETDMAITREIRKSVTAQNSFSTNAKNVKIITRDGVVTLRGPVNTMDEKTKIGALATQPKGVQRVENELEIKTRD
jgi:hyperosmotically inducible periplasmic protein